ncbi:GntR family transcriptional regulator [Pelagibius sp. Alg239-R121]|uniref:GntR family transcriptional regulator n=1 Tax=Pelagibius sp. Alg239-R121 TaxID=2993448 RepID=UPI0024A65137|nr:GntR family transcriptional regulator [Pelagibius sp. Alg239-R121]
MFGNVPIPRYVQLADLMRQRIAKGQWTPGDILPSIETLMREFGVARVTIRQAIRLLAEDGLLSPQRGRGTFVTAAAERKRKLVVETTLDALVAMYSGDKPDLSNMTESDEQPILTENDGIAAPHYFHMRRVHSREGEHYCVASIFIDDRVFQQAPEQLRNEVAIPVLTSLPGVTIATARQTLHISTADLEIARDLQVPVNAPVAEVRRVFCSPDGSVIYLAEATYRGDYIRLEMDLK